MKAEGRGITVDFGSVSMPAKIFDPGKDDLFKTELHKFMGDDYNKLPQRLKDLAETQVIGVIR
jgi:hypothetical protein